MIVDCHTHMKSGGDDVEFYEQLSVSETLTNCIVLADAEEKSQEANQKLSEYVTKNREKLTGFAFVDPLKDNTSPKSLSVLSEKLGLAGAVVYCSACGFHPAHSRAMQFYESAQEVGMPVFFHNSGHLGPEAVLNYAQPVLLDEIARMFPELKIIIGTMGEPFVEQTLLMVSKHENVFADLTIRPKRVWHVYNTVISAHEREVMDKLLFGSGYPLGNAGECIETLLSFNKLLADTNLPSVRLSDIRSVIERDTLKVLGITK